MERLGPRQRFIRAGRPTSNGYVERRQLTPPRGVLAGLLRPLPGAQADRPRARLDEYLTYHNTDRGQTGRPTRGAGAGGGLYRAGKVGAAR